MAKARLNPALRAELLEMAATDLRVRQRLADAGQLEGGYHPEMEAVHRANAARLAVILDAGGWPTPGAVGADGVEAAWLVVQHAIGEPDFQRTCLARLEGAVARGEAPAWQAAMLEDRIRVAEGRPQRYGTQLEHDELGVPRPCPIEDPDGVEARRDAVGLEPLARRLAREPRLDPPPSQEERARFLRERDAWLVRVGWREPARVDPEERVSPRKSPTP